MTEVKKKKLDLSKLSARELLLIGESQSFGGPQPCSSKSFQHSSSNTDEDFDNSSSNEVSSADEDNRDGSDSDDWEEVDDQHVEAELKKYDSQESAQSLESFNSESQSSKLSSIPEGGVQIVIPGEGIFKRRKKGEVSVEDILRREINKDRAHFQLLLHKTSILVQIARGLHLNALISSDSETLSDAISKLIEGRKFNRRFDMSILEKFTRWLVAEMRVRRDPGGISVDDFEKLSTSISGLEFLVYQIMIRRCLNYHHYVLVYAAVLRYLKLDVRLVISLEVIPIKPPFSDLLRKPKLEDDDGADDKKSGKKDKKAKNSKSSSKSRSTEKKTAKPAAQTKTKKVDLNSGRKMISSSEDERDVEDTKSKKANTKPGRDIWIEVYLKEEERWVSVDPVGCQIICDRDLERNATQPLTYVLAFNNDNTIKDVTRRYATDWLTSTQKLRVDPDWLERTLKPFTGKRTTRDEEEDESLDEHVMALPIPKTLSSIRGHPLFVVRPHLHKYEALYPANPPSAGTIKDEPVYSRQYVHTLHTRELWMREAKVVRIGEKPYKIVKGRPKYDKLTGARLPEVPAELFGSWQTEDYIPPIARDGKVPRNDYGNVELFTEKLLPQGCVHLRLPGLQRVAKKLDIDCAPAVVGFDYGATGSRPAFDGFVVCEEFKDTLVDAWNQEQDEKVKREEEKRLQRVYSNWRRLIRGVMIRSKLEKKYSVNLSGKRKNDKDSKTGVSKRARKS